MKKWQTSKKSILVDLPGKTDEQIRTEYAEFRKERAAHKEDLPYPEGGECGCDVARRVMPKIKQICQREENRVAIVTHGGVIRSCVPDILLPVMTTN